MKKLLKNLKSKLTTLFFKDNIRDDIWEYCHNEQKRMLSDGDLSEYEQGMIIAYRKIQWEAKKKCSRFENESMS